MKESRKRRKKKNKMRMENKTKKNVGKKTAEKKK